MDTEHCFAFDASNTFCISLESKSDRWERMTTRFQHFNMDVFRWIASTPDTLSDTFHASLNPYQKACAQSHINIWKHMVEKDIPYALIMEDDAMFDNAWKSKLNDFCNSEFFAGSWDLVVLNCSEIEPELFTWVNCKEQYLTGAYIISLGGVHKVLNHFNGWFCASDWMITRLQLHGGSYTYFPWLVIQEGIESTIGSGVVDDHAKVLRLLNDIDYSIENYV
jgi:GR25 family glycosyltransferase involved in LPS biosynthesis